MNLNLKYLQFLEANQWTDQSQRERIYLCIELKMKNRLHEDCYAKHCKEFEEFKKMLHSWRRKILINNEDWKNFLCSMIRNRTVGVY